MCLLFSNTQEDKLTLTTKPNHELPHVLQLELLNDFERVPDNRFVLISALLLSFILEAYQTA